MTKNAILDKVLEARDILLAFADNSFDLICSVFEDLIKFIEKN